MVPTISKTHLPLYICLFSGLVVLIIVATLYLDREVHEARQSNDVWGVALTVSQRAAPMTIAALGINFIIIEVAFLLFVDIPKSRLIQRRCVVIHNWLEERRQLRQQEKERREQERKQENQVRKMKEEEKQAQEVRRILRKQQTAED